MPGEGADENRLFPSSQLLILRRGNVSSSMGIVISLLSTAFLRSFLGLSGTSFITLYTGNDSGGGVKVFPTSEDDVFEEHGLDDEDEDDALSAFNVDSLRLSRNRGTQ